MAPHLADRLRAAGIHVLISATIAALAAILVFTVWYPGALASAAGVTVIFLILLGVDIALGPLVTLIVFNKRKPELKRDLAIVGAIQLAALLYGLHAVYLARPAFVVFALDRFDLVLATDLDEKKLSAATVPAYRDQPHWGPTTVAARLPDQLAERNALMFGSVSGGDDLQHLPKYYRPYAESASTVAKLSKPLDKLIEFNKEHKAAVDALIAKYREQKIEVGFIPLRAKAKDMAVIVRRSNGDIAEIADLRPW